MSRVVSLFSPKLAEGCHLLPADHLPPCLDVSCPPVLVFQIVSMFPHVQDQQWMQPVRERTVLEGEGEREHDGFSLPKCLACNVTTPGSEC